LEARSISKDDDSMISRLWRVEGFDGQKPLYARDIPAAQITTASLDALLCALVAKHGLTDDELAACFLRRNCTAHRTDLAVAVDQSSGRPQRRCGTNPHFIATLVSVGASSSRINKPRKGRTDA
jgi:hypothetical protein